MFTSCFFFPMVTYHLSYIFCLAFLSFIFHNI
nr:MAG TPA: hypothetical protein [Caudoviricetes sp.]